MACQIPPTRSSSGESRVARVRASPGATLSLRTPITEPVNGAGSVPLLTVTPLTGASLVAALKGAAVGHPAAAETLGAMAAKPLRPVTVNATAVSARPTGADL